MFNRDSLITLISRLIKDKENVEHLKNELGTTKSDNGYNTYYLIPKNIDFKQISITSNKGELVSATFWGDFDITFSALIEMYEDYRIVYIPHDDIYKFFFNEKGEYVVCIYNENEVLDSQQKIDCLEIRTK